MVLDMSYVTHPVWLTHIRCDVCGTGAAPGLDLDGASAPPCTSVSLGTVDFLGGPSFNKTCAVTGAFNK